MTKEATPESGRNEKGQFLPGVSGNLAGRKSGIQSIKEALMSLMTKPMDEVYEISRDKSAPAVYRMCALRLILAMQLEDQRSDKAFDQVADRSEGRPHQSQGITLYQGKTAEELLAEIQTDMGIDNRHNPQKHFPEPEPEDNETSE